MHEKVTPVQVDVVAQQERALRRIVQCGARIEALRVHRLAKPHDLGSECERAHLTFDPIVENDESLHDPGQLRRDREVVLVGMNREYLWSRRIPVGELIRGDALLREHDVAGHRQIVFAVSELEAELPADVDAGPELDVEHRHVVAEPLKLLCNRKRVALGPTEAEVIRAHDDFHSRTILEQAATEFANVHGRQESRTCASAATLPSIPGKSAMPVAAAWAPAASQSAAAGSASSG